MCSKVEWESHKKNVSHWWKWRELVSSVSCSCNPFNPKCPKWTLFWLWRKTSHWIFVPPQFRLYALRFGSWVHFVSVLFVHRLFTPMCCRLLLFFSFNQNYNKHGKALRSHHKFSFNPDYFTVSFASKIIFYIAYDNWMSLLLIDTYERVQEHVCLNRIKCTETGMHSEGVRRFSQLPSLHLMTKMFIFMGNFEYIW